jgi:signal transduction histidine kinase
VPEVRNYRPARTGFGLLFVLVGAAYLLDSVGALHVHAADVWPLLLIAFGVAALLSRARRRQVEEDRSAQLAVAEERVRIARELHDIVAHGVSLMTIQITAARRVAGTKPEAAEQSLLAAEQTGRQAMAELDSLLALLRGADASIGAAATTGTPWAGTTGASNGKSAPSNGSRGAEFDALGRSPLPRLADLGTLVGGLRDAGRVVELKVLGEPPSVPPSVELVIYRVVQEALTNAVRYAGDAPITVEVIYTPETITVFVDDEGPGVAQPTRPGGGHGLLGMSERLATVGGTLEFGPRSPKPGWRVHATIPIMAFVP